MRWIHEPGATWNPDKARVIGGAPTGAFDTRLTGADEGDLLPGDWWRVESDNGEVIAFGWMDVSWGDAEILLATAPDHQGRGVGSFVLEHLEDEAHHQGLNYLSNVVRPSHPHGDQVAEWLKKRGFAPSEDGRLLRASSKR